MLIVEDNATAAQLLRELIELQDHRGCCVHSAQAAIEAAAHNTFALVLVDLSLPDRPGTEVAKALRARAASPAPLLVAMSGHSRHSAVGAQAAPFFDHFLEKPIDFARLDQLLALASADRGGGAQP